MQLVVKPSWPIQSDCCQILLFFFVGPLVQAGNCIAEETVAGTLHMVPSIESDSGKKNGWLCPLCNWKNKFVARRSHCSRSCICGAACICSAGRLRRLLFVPVHCLCRWQFTECSLCSWEHSYKLEALPSYYCDEAELVIDGVYPRLYSFHSSTIFCWGSCIFVPSAITDVSCYLFLSCTGKRFYWEALVKKGRREWVRRTQQRVRKSFKVKELRSKFTFAPGVHIGVHQFADIPGYIPRKNGEPRMAAELAEEEKAEKEWLHNQELLRADEEKRAEEAEEVENGDKAETQRSTEANADAEAETENPQQVATTESNDVGKEGASSPAQPSHDSEADLTSKTPADDDAAHKKAETITTADKVVSQSISGAQAEADSAGSGNAEQAETTS